MDAQASSSRQILWPNVITIVSATILIGAEVFGAAFAGGWALSILFEIEGSIKSHILQGILLVIGIYVMTRFVRAARRVEPFTKRV